MRPHFFVGAALLAAAAVLGVATALRPALVARDLHVIAYLGGLTLVAQGIAYWYLPSFAKRAVILDGMASYSGPILFPAALLGIAIGAARVRAPTLFLGLSLFSVVVFASVLAGPRWRSGIPFWRADGPHRRGDRAAAVVLASAFAWFLLAAIASVGTLTALRIGTQTALIVAWPTALAFFALGALAHLVPRARSRPMLVPLFLASALIAQFGALSATAARLGIAGPWTRGGYVLLLAFLLAALAVAPPRRRKPAGPRMSEAAPFLWGACGALALGVLAASAWPTLNAARAVSAYYALLAAVGLAMAALALLTLPVMFNQRPAAAFLLPSELALLGAGTLLAASLFVALPRWPAAALLAAALLLWLAAMSPLRTPRRQCS